MRSEKVGWRNTRLEDVAELNPESVGAGTPSDFSFRYIDLSSVSQGNIDWPNVAEMHFLQAPSRARRVVRPGDVLFGTVRPALKSHAAIPLAMPRSAFVVSTGFTVVRAIMGTSDPRFLLHYVLGPGVAAEARKAEVGSNYPAVNERDVSRFQILTPPLAEQRRIAEILDTVDEAIRKTEEILAKLEQVKQGLLHDLLTRGIDANGELRDPDRHPEQFKDSPLGRIPKAWKLTTLSQVADVDRGKFTHRPRNDPAFYGGRFPFIQTGDITGAAGGVLTRYSQTLNHRGANVSKEFPAESIAITIAANIADTAILGLPMYFPDSVVGAVVREPNSVRFTQLCIQRSKRSLDAQAPQSAQKNINLQDLRPLVIPHPSPNEQNGIAAVYESLLGRAEAERETLQKLWLTKQGLMDDLLTGRVRVTPLLEESPP